MMLSLISVLVLLVIAFYAVWVGVMGRVNGNEGPELTAGGRLLVICIALVAFGAAYMVYSQPREGADLATTVLATPSTPPDSRGTVMTETVEPAAEVPAPTAAASQTPEADLEEKTPSPASETADAAANTEGLSAAAASLEADRERPRTQAVNAVPVVAAAPVERERSSVVIDAPAARATVSTGKSPRAAQSRSRRNPVLLHVHNALGSDQQREQLTLSIEGKTVADIAVDGGQPSVAVAVPLPRPGLLHYRLEGVSESDGSTRLMGEGCIRVSDGARFAVRRKAGSHKVYLEATRVAG